MDKRMTIRKCLEELATKPLYTTDDIYKAVEETKAKITQLIEKALPKQKYLIDWMSENRKEDFSLDLDESAKAKERIEGFNQCLNQIKAKLKED